MRRPASPSCRARRRRSRRPMRSRGSGTIGYPVLVKAAAAAAARACEIAAAAELPSAAFGGAQREARGVLRRRRRLPREVHRRPAPRRDPGARRPHGNVVHLGERDCSIQRRHQKLIEETPSPAVDTGAARAHRRGRGDAARPIGYDSAGTIEFISTATAVLLPGDEHPDPGRAHGDRDEHRASISCRADPGRRRAAASLRQDDVELRGHAIECRINAEDPANDFARSRAQSRATASRPGPACASTRASGGLRRAAFYDSLLAKLFVCGRDREGARRACCAPSRST